MAECLRLVLNVCLGFLFCILISSPSSRVQAREGITPPPKTADKKPVVANGRVYFLNYIPRRCHTPEPIITTYPYGGRVTEPRALMRKDNPHKIKGSIQIAPSGCLYIEPGCRLEFAPGQGLIVNGTLIARGSEEDGGRIVFTKDRDYEKIIGLKERPWRKDARLVDGNTTMDGRLEVLYRQKWRGVCTNYNNFTKEDVNVTCRHLGFLKGNFTYHSFSRNLSDYLLLEKPNCTGSEDSLVDCSGWTTIKAGLHICDGQQTIGFQCEGFKPGIAVTHWRGIEFYNSSTQIFTNESINTKIEESDSSIWYSDIEYAGLDTFREGVYGINHPYASVSASPYVPFFDNVTIRHGAFDALNFTYILGKINVENCTIENNRGHGMFVKSVMGLVKIEKSVIHHNWGDGVKYYSVNLTMPHDLDKMFPEAYFFCKRIELEVNRYPLYLGEQVVHSGMDIGVPGCKHRFTTHKDMQLTLHFLLLETDPQSEGELRISYGDVGNRMVKTVPVRNGSYPQSITTLSNVIEINFRFLRRGPCLTFKYCLRFLLQLTTNFGPHPEFWITESKVTHNKHHGISVQDMKSLIWINSTIIADNMYEAGLRVFQGAGIVNINNTLLENNALAGANITYSGGSIFFNHTRVTSNQGYGIFMEFLKLNRSRIEDGLTISSYFSNFSENSLAAFRVGNYCMSANVLIDQGSFKNNFREAIEYLSCNVTSMKANFSVTMSTFQSNIKEAILMAPMLNIRGKIANNTFRNHFNGALRINNGIDLLVSRWYAKFPVDYDIYGNDFIDNYGPYAVNIRLTEESSEQALSFVNNKLVDNNIQNSFPFLNPRSKANAVLIISSSKVVATKNIIYNPNSTREMSTHLNDPSKTIEAKMNYWGSDKYQNFYLRIFDRDDRYNLAVINFIPALADERFYENYKTQDLPPDSKRSFLRQQVIGGELDERKELSKGYYHVDKDIYIEPRGVLVIPPGTVLTFDNSVGMIVYGALVADGNNQGWVKFLLEDNYDSVVENMTFPIRLADGTNEKEGRLEVEIDGSWGTVCRKGWTERNSAVSCNQLGLTYNPLFGQPQTKVSAPPSTPILLNWVSCTEEDFDLTKCLAEVGSSDPIHCSHEQDVFIQCQTPTWSGITLAAVPKIKDTQETQIRSVVIDRAGMLDHSSMRFSSALQIDYNYYDISNLTVTESSADGIYVKFNHPYTNNRMQHCNVYNSRGNGLVTKYPFLEVAYSTYRDNFLNGFRYDPFFTEAEALSVRNFMRSDQVTVLKESRSYSLRQETTIFTTELGQFTMDKAFQYEFKADDNKLRPTIQILNYNPVTSVEKVIVSDNVKEYHIEDDLIDFPVVSSTELLKVRVTVIGVMSGRLAFVIVLALKSEVPEPRVYLRNCTLFNNDIGMVTRHYNNPSNDKQELYFRFREESIRMDYVNIENSRTHAMHVPSVTKYHENFIPTYEELTRPQRVGTISYVMNRCHFIGNAQGITAEHNHVEFANNVWKWHIMYCIIKDNMNGGMEIELPRVNDISEHLKHSVEINHTVFEMNKNFAFSVNGYFADVKISYSIWKNNICRLGLFDLTGMEKNISMALNFFTNNACRYIINFDIISHYEYMYPVVGNFSHNKIYDNGLGTAVGGEKNSPSTFAVALKGLQHMVLNRNLFNNPKLRYEFIAGVTCLSLDSIVDVTENWWGSSYQDVIQKKIFDFDSWNNFGIAKFIPYLLENEFTSKTFSTAKQELIHNGLELGGRINEDKSLFATGTPYEVINDITVMPGVVLKIEPGAVLHFKPNVGILVLGTLDARGLPLRRIKMAPSPVATNQNNIRKRSVTFKIQQISKDKARLSGGSTPNEGFLQFYNTSTNQWDIMCNERLPEKVAEVICRQLGFETINVRVYTSHLFDHYIYGLTTYFTKSFWRYSYYCKGNEDSLDQCTKKIDYRIMSCIQNENYTFLHCGKRNLEAEYNYWGNIRFSRPSYQEDLQKKDTIQSFVRYVDIHGAGVLHGNKVGAIQSVYRTPVIQHVNITSCASNGIDFISPLKDLLIDQQNITDNLGYGVNILVLNGDSKISNMASFLPLVQSTIPYYLFGLVEMCLLEKEIVLETKMLVYYKYSSNAIDCVKLIKSKYSDKQLALRFLQMNLFSEDFMRNLIEIFDGGIGNQNKIGEITSNSSAESVNKLYRTSKEPHTLTLHIHASIASRDFGFIAEVVTLPQSSTGIIDSKVHHTLESTVLRRNEDGAFTYKNVGEINPSVKISKCLIEENGVRILNLTSPPVVDIYLQNTKTMSFANNFVLRNGGGNTITLHTDSFATAIEANITNNIFTSGTHGSPLMVNGRNYQKVVLFENYFFNNSAGDDQNIVLLKDVTVNFTSNYFFNNTAYSILSVFALEMVSTPHLYTRSSFVKNNATALYESTVKIHSGKPVFYNNYFVNPENLYEIEANPISNFSGSKEPIDAKENWWGFRERYFIAAKIRDADNDKNLVPIDYIPYKVSAPVDGKCNPGWRSEKSRCFRYMGGVQNYYGAIRYCQSLGAELMESKDLESFIQRLLIDSEFSYDAKLRIWVNRPSSFGMCGVFYNDFSETEANCNLLLLPFICETDPYLVNTSDYTLVIALTVGIFSSLIIIIIVLVVLWLVKSKRRKEERLKRCASFRTSARSRSNMSMNWSKHNIHESRSDLSYMATLDQVSMNSEDKSKFNSYNTDATEISPPIVVKPPPLTTVVPYDAENENDSDNISFTDDESFMSEDNQNNICQATPRYNTNIINQVWNEKVQQQKPGHQQYAPSDELDIYRNLNLNRRELSPSMHSLHSNEADKKPIINQMQATPVKPPSPPPPLFDYEPSEELKSFSKIINQKSRDGSKDSLNQSVGPSNPVERVPYPKPETMPRNITLNQGRAPNYPRNTPAGIELPSPSSVRSNFGSREDLTNGNPNYPSRDFQQRIPEMSQNLDPGVAYLQRNTFERGSSDRINSPEPLYSEPPGRDYSNQGMDFYKPNPASSYKPFRGSRENLDTATTMPAPHSQYKPSPAPRPIPATRSRDSLYQPRDSLYQPGPPIPRARLQPTETSDTLETDIF